MSQRYTLKNRNYNLNSQSCKPFLKQNNLERSLSLEQVTEDSPIKSGQDALRCQYFIYSSRK